MLRSILPKFEFIPPDWFAFQNRNRLFSESGTFGPLLPTFGLIIAAAALSSSDIMRASISLPIMGILKTMILYRIYRKSLPKLELPTRDQKITLAVCLGVSLLPPLTATFLLWGWSAVLWLFGYAGLYLWLLYWMGGRGPVRSEVEASLAYGQGIVNQCKEALDKIEKDRPKTDDETAKNAEVERVKKVRDERLSELVAASRDADNPLPAMTVAAQLLSIHGEYEQAIGRIRA